MKNLKFISIFVLAVTVFTTCEDKKTNTQVTGVSISEPSLVLTVGQSKGLVAIVDPADATGAVVFWSSSVPGVASVDDAGLVTAIAPGDTNITATVGKHSATCAVTVNSAVIPVPATGVEIAPGTLKLTIGDNSTLTATVSPEGATDNVVWSSSDPAVATVDKTSGLVTALTIGTADITATAGDVSDICVVTVDAATIPVTGISLNTNMTTLTAGETELLAATVTPADATDSTVTWESSNNAVATVVNGLVTAVLKGETLISAKAGDQSVSCLVTVRSASAGFEVAEANLPEKYSYESGVAACPAGWRLPTRDELMWMCHNRDQISGLDNGYYLSSETYGTSVYLVSMASMGRCYNDGTGSLLAPRSEGGHPVRCVKDEE